MRIATIHGHAVSTVKHRSLEGWRLLIAQPRNNEGEPDGPPQLVIDCLGAGIGQRVLISSDGMEARAMVEDQHSPVRWNVMGIIDPEGQPAR